MKWATGIATFARGFVIAIVALSCVIAYGVGSLHRLFMSAERRAHHRARQRGRLTRWSFERLGACFVKVGQVISSRPDVFTPEVIEELRGLQDHVHPFSYRRVRKVLERELQQPLEWVFSEFDREPLAAGSMAQVHRAVLDGHDVAVKVLRPGVRACVRRDAAILLALARIAHWLVPRARAADVRGHARSLVAGILAQTDLRREAANYDRFREHFADATGVAFPYVHHRYSTCDVLTMELVRGTSLEKAAPEHLPQVTRELRSGFFTMCFEHGLVHADLHPGNMLVRDDGVVVLLDVGLVKELSPRMVETVVDFARCLAMGAASDLVRHLQTHHEHTNATDWQAVEVDAAIFVTGIRGRAITELETSAIVSQLFALARKHRIRPMPELSLVLLGMVTIEGIAKRLDPAANTLNEIAAFLGRTVGRRRLARGSNEHLSQPVAEPSMPVAAQPVPAGAPPPAVPADGAATEPLPDRR